MPAKKRVVAKAPAKKRTIKTEKSEEMKRFVVINEYDPQTAKKETVLRIIVGGLAVILIGFWIWTFNQNQIHNPNSASTNDNLGQTLGETAQKIKDSFSQTQENFTDETEGTTSLTGLEQIKNDIIKQIEGNLSNNLWPEYSSSSLNLSLAYPAGWQLSEKADIITLTFTANSTTPTSTDSKIEISKIKKTSFKPEKSWLQSPVATTTSALDMTKYIRTDLNNNIDWLITFPDKINKNIYQISIKFSGGKNIYEPLLEKIISNINFLK